MDLDVCDELDNDIFQANTATYIRIVSCSTRCDTYNYTNADKVTCNAIHQDMHKGIHTCALSGLEVDKI